MHHSTPTNTVYGFGTYTEQDDIVGDKLMIEEWSEVEMKMMEIRGNASFDENELLIRMMGMTIADDDG